MDIEVLGPDGEPDPQLPQLAGVPLPLPTGGEEMGMYAFPEEGTQVVVCFAYGLPNKPYIQTILPHGPEHAQGAEGRSGLAAQRSCPAARRRRR
ncbi:hypothetical protein ABIA60_004408 [Pseudomonas frederiksbergensis]